MSSNPGKFFLFFTTLEQFRQIIRNIISGVFLSMQLQSHLHSAHYPEFCFKFGTVYFHFRVLPDFLNAPMVYHVKNAFVPVSGVYLKVHKRENLILNFVLFLVSYAKILRFCKKSFSIGPLSREIRLFRLY